MLQTKRTCDLCGAVTSGQRAARGVRYDYCEECVDNLRSCVMKLLGGELENTSRDVRMALSYLLRSTALEVWSSPKRQPVTGFLRKQVEENGDEEAPYAVNTHFVAATVRGS